MQTLPISKYEHHLKEGDVFVYYYNDNDSYFIMYLSDELYYFMGDQFMNNNELGSGTYFHNLTKHKLYFLFNDHKRIQKDIKNNISNVKSISSILLGCKSYLRENKLDYLLNI